MVKKSFRNRVSTRFLKLFKEATPGFGPGIRVLQTHALPLGYVAEKKSDRYDCGRCSSLSWTRTNDTAVNSRVLYRLSYEGS